MRNIYKCIFVTVYVLGSVKAFAWGDDKSLKECSELLPKGHTFKYSISGEVDTTDAKYDFKVKMDLTDGSGEPNPELEKAVKPYIKCVSKLIK